MGSRLMDDIRYSEFLFLEDVAAGKIDYFNANDQARQRALGLPQNGDFYVEMAITALEDLSIRFDNPSSQRLVARLRREYNGDCPDEISGMPITYWDDPRYGLHTILRAQNVQRIRITFRGLRRIEELRDLLRRDRILEHFGILLDLRYFRPDLQRAIQSSEAAVSVIYADMDNFKPINDKCGHEAGDVVMKSYLEVIRDRVGDLGRSYRGLGDETLTLIVAQERDAVLGIAEAIRTGVEALRCSYKGKELPKVTASIGVATAPPEHRKYGT